MEVNRDHEVNCLGTHIFLNIFLCVQKKKKGSEQLEGE